jgi:hypothetical protein
VNYFSQADSLGSKSRESIAEYLRDIGDDDAADRFSRRGGGGQSLTGRLLGIDQYAHTGILLGFIEPGPSRGMIPVENALQMPADESLKGTRIKITLDKFYVQSYPGNGTHSVLCEFAGKNQISGDAEEMRFALTAEVNDLSSAAVSGAPIFLGVSVGQDGIAFEGRTINVRSSTDDLLMEALGTDTFRDGLALLTVAQPALKPFVGLASNVVKAVLGRSKNKQVYTFRLGLDFGSGATSAGLRIGSYVVVQADSATWDWNQVRWNSDSASVVLNSTGESVPYNYMVFGVTSFAG